MRAAHAPAAYAGLDLGRATGFALLDADGVLLHAGVLRSDAEILSAIDSSGVRTVAIDCPLGLPAGLCCLEASCGCAPSREPGIRTSELAVRARGYGLYHTTKRSIIRPLVYRGMALQGELRARGLRTMEVYPYATKVALFGRPVPKKASPEGLAWLVERVAGIVPGVELKAPWTHDELDAVLAAHTAFLLERGRAEALGDPAEGCIVVPG